MCTYTDVFEVLGQAQRGRTWVSKITLFSSQLLKSKSDGEVGQPAPCGAAAPPQSSSAHETNASSKVRSSSADSRTHWFVELLSRPLIRSFFFFAGVAVGAERHVTPIRCGLPEAAWSAEHR